MGTSGLPRLARLSPIATQLSTLDNGLLRRCASTIEHGAAHLSVPGDVVSAEALGGRAPLVPQPYLPASWRASSLPGPSRAGLVQVYAAVAPDPDELAQLRDHHPARRSAVAARDLRRSASRSTSIAATMPGFHAGRSARSKGLRYPADLLKVEEIIRVMRAAGDRAHGRRLRGLIAVLWRSGLRIREALALPGADLDYLRGALLVRRGKGGRRREVGIRRTVAAAVSAGVSLLTNSGTSTPSRWPARACRWIVIQLQLGHSTRHRLPARRARDPHRGRSAPPRLTPSSSICDRWSAVSSPAPWRRRISATHGPSGKPLPKMKPSSTSASPPWAMWSRM
jgi:Phage integrase family